MNLVIYFIIVKAGIFAIIAWIGVVYTICSIGRYIIRSFAFFIAIITITAFTFSITLGLALRIFMTLCIFIIDRVKIVICSLIN